MNVFVSYRRADSRDAAARIASALADAPGISEVFIDVAGIEVGAQFVQQIERKVASADAVLVIIGQHWLAGERLDDPGDFVRQELALALGSGKRVIPVLIHGASMPRPDALPEAIRPLVYLNASFVRHETFDQDLIALVDALLGRKPAGSQLARLLRRHPVLVTGLRSVGGATAGLVALLAVGIVHQLVTERSLNETMDTRVVWSLIVGLPLAGAVLPWLLRRG